MTARLRALEREAERRAQAADRFNLKALFTSGNHVPDDLKSALRRALAVYGDDLGRVARLIAAETPSDLGLETEGSPAWEWVLKAARAIEGRKLLPMPSQGVADDLRAQAGRWGQFAQDHAGQRLGRLGRIAQGMTLWYAYLADTVSAESPRRADRLLSGQWT